MHIGYFSRNLEEALSQPDLITGDLGDEWGELTSFDRTLNITAGPKPLQEKPLNPELIEKLKRNEKLITGLFSMCIQLYSIVLKINCIIYAVYL
jgi:hypothetical protein